MVGPQHHAVPRGHGQAAMHPYRPGHGRRQVEIALDGAAAEAHGWNLGAQPSTSPARAVLHRPADRSPEMVKTWYPSPWSSAASSAAARSEAAVASIGVP